MPFAPRDHAASSPAWAEVVFHVLAHVPARGLASSLYSTWYVQFVESWLGPAALRPLEQDVAVLRVLMRDHASFAAVQGLAWLWRDSADALACAELELPALGAHDVVSSALLEQLNVRAYALEALRSAALLEIEAYAKLPAPHIDSSAFDQALVALRPCAPALASAQVSTLRPLTRHGRVLGSTIFVGVPDADVSLEHAAMQAAHEATVAEVLARASSLRSRVRDARATPVPEREVEAIALVLLAERCAGSAHEASHRAWCQTWELLDEHLDAARLSPTALALRDACSRG